jgi:uncharacterized protein YqjF (DUF2071 family)
MAEPVSGDPPDRIDRPVMTQQWRTVTFLHWAYEPEMVQRLLPEGLEVDSYDGSAWVGLVPFWMEKIAARFTPPIPYLGTFPETNVRTYVRGPHGPGVWFHSLDVNRLLPVLVARGTYRLPYLWGRMSLEDDAGNVRYTARRRWPGPRGARSTVTVRVGEPVAEPSPLDHFLTARWRLYTMLGSRLATARVEHPAWPLHRATVETVDDQFVAAAGYPPPGGSPHVLFSPGVPVRVELPRMIDAS